MRKLGTNLQLLMTALVAAVVVLVAPQAHAAVFVPMCSEHAETVTAPPIVLPSKDSTLERVTPSCPIEETELYQAPNEAPRPSSLPQDDGPLRAWPSLVYLPSVPVTLAPLIDAELPAPPAGFAESIYRPPRAA